AWSSGMAQSACSASTPVLIQNVDSQRQCQTSDAGLSCTKECHDETAGAHWQLHRFLLVLSSRPQRRDNVARPGKRANAELEMVASRIPWAREFRCRQWDGRAPTKRADQGARRSRAGIRSN